MAMVVARSCPLSFAAVHCNAGGVLDDLFFARSQRGMSLAETRINFGLRLDLMPLGNYPIGVERNTRSANRFVRYSEPDSNGANARK
jgi:hypothetical protein